MTDTPNQVYVLEQPRNNVVISEENGTVVVPIEETTVVVKVGNVSGASSLAALNDVDMNNRDDGSLPEYDAGREIFVLRRDLRRTIMDGGNF